MGLQILRNSFLAVCLLFTAGALVAQDQNDEFQQLYNEYLEINQRLQTVQQQALQDRNVAEQAEEYSNFVDSKLKGLDTRAAELVDQRETTIDNIEAAQDEGDIESIQELQQDYEMITQELQPYMQQAMMDEEVQQRQQELEAVLIAKMEEIDPDTVPLLNRMMEISEQIDRMMQQQQE